MRYLFRLYRDCELVSERVLSAEKMVEQLAKVSVLLGCGSKINFHEEYDTNYNLEYYQIAFKSPRGVDILHRYFPTD